MLCLRIDLILVYGPYMSEQAVLPWAGEVTLSVLTTVFVLRAVCILMSIAVLCRTEGPRTHFRGAVVWLGMDFFMHSEE